MSDDEDYNDEYDEEWVYFDDGEPDPTEDVPVGTSYSPVYLDDQALYAAFESDSDWDYYSDDYFEEEPSTTKKRPGHTQLSTTENAIGDRQFDPDMFCGVVWGTANPSGDAGQHYEPGTAETVALLKDWREIFQEAKPKATGTFHDRLASRSRQRKPGRPLKAHQKTGIAINARNTNSSFNPTPKESKTINGLGELSQVDPPSQIDSIHKKPNPIKSSSIKNGFTCNPTRASGSRLKEVSCVSDVFSVDSTRSYTTNASSNIEIIVPPPPANANEYDELGDVTPSQKHPRGKSRMMNAPIDSRIPKQVEDKLSSKRRKFDEVSNPPTARFPRASKRARHI
ncbi:hypothetical protein FQN57_007198 [Myotisia sp. PD_48]|nr:hypothetical protein FQN57_007198 [Myotisia sp. PD_48]